jgi:sec-independent protein translocase protein TatB
MFEVGFTEIVLILGLALLVLGPEKLPGLAQKVGRWTGRARAMARQLRTQLEQEVTVEELARSQQTAAKPQPATPPDAASQGATPSEPQIHPDPTLSGAADESATVSTPSETAAESATDTGPSKNPQ